MSHNTPGLDPRAIPRTTTLMAFQAILPQLPQRRREVYTLIYEYGPGTSAEILAHAPPKPHNQLTQSRARFTELRCQGVIHELGEVKCRVTGHQAILWDTTAATRASNLTKRNPVGPTKSQLRGLLEEALKQLEDGDLIDLMVAKEIRGQL